jgi:hypothetical protein
MTKKLPVHEQRTIVQLVLIDETGDSYYRMRWPGAQVAEQAPEWRVLSLDARAEERFIWAEEADLLITYQSNDLDLLPLIERRRKKGKKTLAEYNDNFYAPPAASPVAEPWSSPLIWQSYERIMNESDGLIVTGPGLNELFSSKTSNSIHILENHLPKAPPNFDELWAEPQDTINLGWAGSLGHIADVIAVVPVLKELLELEPRLRIHIMGNDSLPDILGFPENRLSYTSWGPMSQYYEFWRPIHLGIAPLLDTPYNRCRSDIKAVEMSGLGVLPLLSDSLPYQSFIGETKAPVFKSGKELKNLVLKYLKNVDKMREDCRRCFDHVRTKRVGGERTERLSLYASMLPEETSNYAWPFPNGYHEVQGTLKTSMRYAAIVQQAEAVFKNAGPAHAAALTTQALEQNPAVPDLALNELRYLRAANNPEIKERISSYIKRFPLDLRFYLFKVISLSSPEERILGWREIADKLEAEAPPYASFFKNEVVKIFGRHLAQTPDLIAVGERLLKQYPQSATLRFQMAHVYEKTGQTDKAAECFTWLLEAREITLGNREFFEATQLGYLKSWEEGLQARSFASSNKAIFSGRKKTR